MLVFEDGFIYSFRFNCSNSLIFLITYLLYFKYADSDSFTILNRSFAKSPSIKNSSSDLHGSSPSILETAVGLRTTFLLTDRVQSAKEADGVWKLLNNKQLGVKIIYFLKYQTL